MAANPKPERDSIRFGKFVLDLADRRLTCSGQPVKLSSRALEILCELAAVPGEVVSKDRLMENVWAGRVVEENAIQVHVSVAKSARSRKRRQQLRRHSSGTRHRLVGSMAGVMCRRTQARRDAGARDVGRRSSVRQSQRGYQPGLLRRRHRGGHHHGLSRITGLSVVGSTSSLLFEAGSGDLASIGRKLGCRYLVQGSVRKANDRIRITARLVE